jgi:rhodanese-related sulfurtransferase
MTITQYLLENWVLVLVALSSGVMLMLPAMRSAGAGIGTAEAVRLINREKGVLIDVRDPEEFAAGHAAGARNVPLASLQGEGAKGLPTNKALPVVVLCASGARASRAAGILRKAGFEKAVVLQGGTAAWREASLPIEKSA